jgi:hypothetical protein
VFLRASRPSETTPFLRHRRKDRAGSTKTYKRMAKGEDPEAGD